jgi:hypothetical protein
MVTMVELMCCVGALREDGGKGHRNKKEFLFLWEAGDGHHPPTEKFRSFLTDKTPIQIFHSKPKFH